MNQLEIITSTTTPQVNHAGWRSQKSMICRQVHYVFLLLDDLQFCYSVLFSCLVATTPNSWSESISHLSFFKVPFKSMITTVLALPNPMSRKPKWSLLTWIKKKKNDVKVTKTLLLETITVRAGVDSVSRLSLMEEGTKKRCKFLSFFLIFPIRSPFSRTRP